VEIMVRPLRENKKERGNTTNWIYTQLKKDILTGKIESGTLLSEIEIARQYGVSRTPVRNALGNLACERVVVALPQRGHLVRTITYSEVVEAFRVREILEVEAAGEAAIRITDEQISELKQIYQGRLGEEAVWWNYRFHVAVAKYSGNRLLLEFVEETLVLMQRLLIDHPDMQIDSTEPERKIIQALETRNPEIARDTMRDHIQDAMERLLNKNNGKH
jgi:DNA-binding GntR family transcriptional regulator